MISELSSIAKEDFVTVQDEEFSFLFHSGLEVITATPMVRGKDVPIGIIKISRAPEYRCLSREFDMLSHIDKHADPAFRESVPRPLRLRTIHGLDVLSMTFLNGKVLGVPRGSMKKVKDYFGKMRSWIVRLSGVPVPASKEKCSRFTEARERVARLAERYARSTVVRRIVEQVPEYEKPSMAVRIPTVITHRDLGSPNMLLDGDQIRVIDWGNSHYGYPLSDWVRFVCYWLVAADGYRDVCGSLRGLLLGNSEMSELFYEETQQFYRDCALDADLVAPLFLLSVFDYLESFHSYASNDWEEKFSFLLARGEWVDRLGVNTESSSKKPIAGAVS